MLGLEQRLHGYEPLFGSWHVCGEIGSGNFGRVYRVETRDLFGGVHTAALKVVEILPDRTLADTPERVRALAKKHMTVRLARWIPCAVQTMSCIWTIMP